MTLYLHLGFRKIFVYSPYTRQETHERPTEGRKCFRPPQKKKHHRRKTVNDGRCDSISALGFQKNLCLQYVLTRQDTPEEHTEGRKCFRLPQQKKHPRRKTVNKGSYYSISALGFQNLGLLQSLHHVRDVTFNLISQYTFFPMQKPCIKIYFFIRTTFQDKYNYKKTEFSITKRMTRNIQMARNIQPGQTDRQTFFATCYIKQSCMHLCVCKTIMHAFMCMIS